MRKLYLDTETYNAIHDIRKSGSYAYAETCELMLLGYAVDDQPARVWDLTETDVVPEDFADAVEDPGVVIVAHNTMFDRPVLSHTLGRPEFGDIRRWYDTQAKALTMGLPSSLGQIGEALGLSEDQAKSKEGKKLINRFCKPAPSNHKAERYTRETHPEEWARFVDYCRQDVEALRTIDKLIPSRNYDREIELWYLDQEINERGLPVDWELVAAAERAAKREMARLSRRAMEITGDQVTSATNVKQTMAWLETRGLRLPDLTKATVANTLRRLDIPKDVRDLLIVRRQAGKTSVSKYTALRNAVCKDGRVRGTQQYCGAMRTGRWAGRIFQPQNLPSRGLPEREEISLMIDALKADVADLVYPDVMQVLSHCIRGAIQETDGPLGVADYSGIEGRVLAWTAQEEWKIQFYRDFDAGRVDFDSYVAAYAKAFSMDPAEVTKDKRQMGKVLELACGYQGSVGAFNTFCATFGIPFMDEQLVNALVGAWRGAHPSIVRLWYKTEDAVKNAIRAPGQVFPINDYLKTVVKGDYLFIRLPSGRLLAYYDPQLDEVSGQSTYMGVDQYTRKWVRLESYGGKFVENIIQGIARDLMAEGIHNAEAAGAQVLMTVHDEAVARNASGEQVAEAMEILPAWADGLPLVAVGETMERYGK